MTRIQSSISRRSPDQSVHAGSSAFLQWRNPVAALALFALAAATLDAMLFVALQGGHAFWGRQHLEWTSAAYLSGSMAIVSATAVVVRFDPPALGRHGTLGAIGLTAVAIALLIGTLALQSFPNSGDEYAYLFQTMTYEAGRLWNAPPPLGQAMASNYTWVTADKWAGGYSPGWPLVMMPAVGVGLAGWTVNLILLPIAVFLFHDLVRRRAGMPAATLAASLFALSPFTLFNAASYFPHILSATMVVLACWCADRLRSDDRPWTSLLLGAAAGLLGITRTIDAVVLAVPLATMLVWRAGFWRRSAWLVALGGLPFLAGLLWYQWRLTGNPLEPTYYLGGRTVDHLYFDRASLGIGAKLTGRRLYELALWTSAPAVLLWAAALSLKLKHRKVEPIDFLLPIVVAVFLFYPLDGGNRYGPRYYFDFWMSLPFTIGTALPLMDGRVGSLGRSIVLLVVIQGLTVTAFLARDYHMLVTERRDVFDGAERSPNRPMVVCVRSPSGLHLGLDTVDLTRNGIDAAGRIIYARCNPDIVAAVRSSLPGRALRFYVRDADAVHGRFLVDRSGGGRHLSD